MLRLALNHMTTPRLDTRALIALAARLGCTGVELRTDLAAPLFGGESPQAVAALAAGAGLAIHGVAQLDRFNDWTDDRAAAAEALFAQAAACGAPAVALIPRNDGGGTGNGERQANLRLALRELAPRLEAHGLTGLVEPLGFDICSLRHKSEAVEIIEALGMAGRFRLVHDSFHHHLAGGGPLFPAHTGIVHVSGVTDPSVATREMTDAHRGLVDAGDRLGTVAQIADLSAAGYDGPVSMEAFAPDVHALADPEPALAASFDHIRSRMAAHAA